MVNESTLLFGEVDALMARIRREGEQQTTTWGGCISRADFGESAANLAYYMAFRRHDLRALILGGASRTLLSSMTVPVLMAH